MPRTPELATRARAGALDPAQVAEIALTQARERLQFDIGLVHSWDEKSGTLPQLYRSDPTFSDGTPVRPGEGALGVAFQERRAVLIEDYESWPGAVSESVVKGIKSIIAVPLLNGEQAVGAMVVATYSARRFTRQDAEVLAGYAAQVAPALEAARLAAEREIQLRVFRTLQEVAQAASGNHSPVELGQVAVDRARDLLRVNSGFLYMFDPEDGMIRRLSENDPLGPGNSVVKPGEGLVGRAFVDQAPVVASDYANHPDAVASAVERGQASVMAVPLMVVDRPIGALGVMSMVARVFTPEDVALLSLLAAQVAPALEASRLLKEREGQVRELRALHEVAVAASGVFDAEGLAKLTVDHARDLLGVDSAVLRFWDSADGRLRLLATNDDHAIQRLLTIGPDEGTLGRAFQESRPVVVDNYSGSATALGWATEEGVQTAMAVPLLVGQRPVGAIAVATYRPHHYTAAQIRMLTLLAAQVAPALEAARLTEERQAQQERMRALHQLAADASGLLDPAMIATLAVAKATEMLRGDKAVFVWLEPTTGVLTSLTGPIGDRLSVVPGEGAVGVAFKTGRPLIVANYQSWRSRVPDDSEIQSTVAVPLFSGLQRVGALCVDSSTPRNFTYEDAEVLSMVGSQVVPAIEAARLHKSLASSEAEFRTLFESVNCGVIVQDRDGIIIDANPAAATILGVEREDIPGHLPGLSRAGWSRSHEDGSPVTPATSPSNIAIQTRKPVLAVIRYSRGEEEMWLQLDCVPQLDAKGEVARIVTSMIDVTGVRQAEASRKESEAKSRFLAAMSHELRTPLNSVLGFAQLLQTGSGGPLSDRQKRYVENIRSSGGHLLALVNDVLDLSKVAAGQMDLEFADVDLEQVLEDTLARIRPLADEKHLDLQMPAPGQPCKVYADERRLAQVVWNLLSNAIKFTPEGGRVCVAVQPGVESAGFSVEDTGIGIPADQLQRIFEEFTQVDSGRNRTHEGTGLGLPLSRQLVGLMGGRIEASSTPDKGSMFTVRLPVAAGGQTGP
jgi:PAS domain S-box-containing protein